MFNRYFVSVFSKKSEIDMDAEAGDNGPYKWDVNVDRDVVLKYIQRMGQNKAPGADNIYRRVLKEVKAEVVDALVEIFQESIETGEVPMDLKCANIVPIYKKGVS